MSHILRRERDIEELILVVCCVCHVVLALLLLFPLTSSFSDCTTDVDQLDVMSDEVTVDDMEVCEMLSVLMACTSESLGVGADVEGLGRGMFSDQVGLADYCFEIQSWAKCTRSESS